MRLYHAIYFTTWKTSKGENNLSSYQVFGKNTRINGKRNVFNFHSIETRSTAPPQAKQKIFVLHSVPNILDHLLPDS